MRDPSLSDTMVWMCPHCHCEWESKEPGSCPKCGTKLYAPRPTFGLMYPMIAAMNMIDEGFDPRDGEIDETIDRLMDDQIRALGGERIRPTPSSHCEAPRRRIVVLKPDMPEPEDSENLIVLRQIAPTKQELGPHPKCSICFEPMKASQRIVKLGCGHIFHASCISNWMRKHPSCPTCKK